MHGFFIYKIAYSSVMMHLVPAGMGLPVSEVPRLGQISQWNVQTSLFRGSHRHNFINPIFL
jgi:hypothetical protein